MEGPIMKKLRLRRLVSACVIAISIGSVATNRAEALMNNAANFDNQNYHVQDSTTGAIYVKRNGGGSFVKDLENAVFVISCGLLGIFLLRMANKR